MDVNEAHILQANCIPALHCMYSGANVCPGPCTARCDCHPPVGSSPWLRSWPLLVLPQRLAGCHRPCRAVSLIPSPLRAQPFWWLGRLAWVRSWGKQLELQEDLLSLGCAKVPVMWWFSPCLRCLNSFPFALNELESSKWK